MKNSSLPEGPGGDATLLDKRSGKGRRIIGPENANCIISTDFKGAGHNITPCIVDKSPLSDAQVLQWHFDKVSEYGFGGWWIWSYKDCEKETTGLRRLNGTWKKDLVRVVRKRSTRRMR